MIRKSFLFVIIVAFFYSCDSTPPPAEALLPLASSNTGKILIILEKHFWETQLEVAIKEVFEAPITTIPEPHEPLFDLTFSARNSFNKTINTQNSIIFFDIEDTPENEPARLLPVLKDFWANGQIVFKIKARNVGKATKVFMANAVRLKEEINKHQRQVAGRKLTINPNISLTTKIEEKYKLKLNLPGKMLLKRDSAGFLRLDMLTYQFSEGRQHEIQQGLLIYSYPYKDDSTLTANYQLDLRDSLLKKHVHMKGSGYMATERNYHQPVTIAKKENNAFVLETRGLWNLRESHDMMGGAFVNCAFYDEANKRIVNIEGYVYAPHFAKREYLRDLEYIIYSAQMVQ